jgi:ABC-2 type transport system ATP-binding protein
MIQVEHLVKRYGQKTAVNDISFSINEGEIFGFLGPNGAGKSTTMNIVTGYLSADSGNVSVGGFSVFDSDLEAKKRIGFLPEQPPLYLDMTVREYLNFVYDLKSVKGEDRAKHLSDIYELVGITDVATRKIGNLSKGYKQRVGLAQALVGSPPVLILDEPTVGLDPRQIIEIRNVIKELGKKSTVILSSHILPEVQAVCERILVINNGVIVADGATETLTSNIEGKHQLQLRVEGSPEAVLPVIKNLPGVVFAEVQGEGEPGAWDYTVESRKELDLRRDLMTALTSSGFVVLQMKAAALSLEEVFIKLVTNEEAPENGAAPDNESPSEGEDGASEEESK